MTDTPRTDAAFQLSIAPGHNIVCPNFARQLERELAEAKKDSARLDWLERPQKITHYVNPFRDVVHRTNSGLPLRAAIDAAREGGK